jgi:DNA-binding IclR family transcriptional regulator
MARSSRQVPAVARAFDILALYLDGRGARSIPQITAALDLPRSSTHELVKTLVALNCLRAVDGHAHRYDLCLHLFELGSAYASSIDLAEQGQAVARDLVGMCDETVHVATLDGVDVIYLVKADSRQAVRMVSAVGRRLPSHCTAVGKILLAGLADDEVTERYRRAGEWTTMTPNSLPGVDALLAELRASGSAGWRSTTASRIVMCAASPLLSGVPTATSSRG